MNPRVDFDLNHIKDEEYILGIDEVGWGCVAGPVVLGGCLVSRSFYEKYQETMKEFPLFEKVRDSKKLRENRRKEMFDFLNSYKGDIKFFIGMADTAYINENKLAKAYTLAFDNIIEQVTKSKPTISVLNDGLKYVQILIDGSRDPKSSLVKKYELIVKGDDSSLAISMASLFSKEFRDSFMRNLEQNPKYSMYEFSKNKGYGTEDHTKLIKEYGISDQHRTEATKNLIE